MKKYLSLLAACCLVHTACASLESDVDAILPQLASEKIAERYDAWIKLQNLAANSSKPGADAQREALANILADKASDEDIDPAARMWVIRQLENIGGEESVNALASVLESSNAELRECARRALEKNPAARASTSLRSALKGGGDAAWEIGLMNSLGQRRDTKSVAAIAQRLSKPETAETAARALGRIASSEAVAALWQNTSAKGAFEGLILAAQEQARAKDSAGAKTIYEKLYASAKGPIRAAALSGLAQIDFKATESQITEAIKGSDPKLRHVALSLLANAGANGASMIETIWLGAFPELKTQMLGALNNVPEKLALESANGSDANLRLAGLEALGRVGGVDSVPVLLKAAGGDGKAKSAANAALTRLANPAAIEKLETLSANGETATRVLAINTLAARQHPKLAANLVTFAQEPDAAVREAAFAGFQKVGADEVFPTLCQMAAKDPNPSCLLALESVGGRVKDRAAAAKQLLAAVDVKQEKLAANFFSTLTLLGSPEALAAVSGLSHSSDAGIKENAVRALSNWPEYGAAPLLLEIAKDAAASDTLHSLGIQGLAHMARSCENEPASNRAGLVQSGLAACKSTREKTVLLSALAEVPAAESVKILKEALADNDLKNDAAQAGANLAGNLLRSNNRTLAKEMAKAIVDAKVEGDATRRANFILNR